MLSRCAYQSSKALCGNRPAIQEHQRVAFLNGGTASAGEASLPEPIVIMIQHELKVRSFCQKLSVARPKSCARDRSLARIGTAKDSASIEPQSGGKRRLRLMMTRASRNSAALTRMTKDSGGNRRNHAPDFAHQGNPCTPEHRFCRQENKFNLRKLWFSS